MNALHLKSTEIIDLKSYLTMYKNFQGRTETKSNSSMQTISQISQTYLTHNSCLVRQMTTRPVLAADRQMRGLNRY